MTQSRLHDPISRTRQAKKILAVLEDYVGAKALQKKSVLDVGSGSGMIDVYLSSFVGRLIAIDTQSAGVVYPHFRVADALNLPYKNNSFDVVICHQVYEHVVDSQQLFNEIYRVLRPGGVCYLAAMNKWFPWEPHVYLPFASYIPGVLSRIGIRSKSYWQLKKEVKQFTVFDYTQKILNNPKKYHYNVPGVFRLFSTLWWIFAPTFIWILKK